MFTDPVGLIYQAISRKGRLSGFLALTVFPLPLPPAHLATDGTGTGTPGVDVP